MPYKQSKSVLIRPYLYNNDFNIINFNTLNGLIDAAISPLFNMKEEIFIVFRIINDSVKNDFIKRYLQRLEFQDVKYFDLKESDCEETQFLIISTKQYSACILFDFSLAQNTKETVYSAYFNSKQTSEILKILLPDEKFFPERRENLELTEAFSNLIKFSNDSMQELNINKAEKSNLENLTQSLKRDEYLAQKSRLISHEIKNHLSIIDIYTRIIEKTASGNQSCQNATKMIYKSIGNVVKLLQELKNFSEADLNVYNLSETVKEIINSTKEIAFSENIQIKSTLDSTLNVIIDKDKFQNVLLNLIKNAIEALKEINKKNKCIEILTEIKNEKISLQIKNNGNKIEKENQNTIFEEGFTTKLTGTGLGLYICKQNLKEQLCELSLLKSDENETVFEILMNKV